MEALVTKCCSLIPGQEVPLRLCLASSVAVLYHTATCAWIKQKWVLGQRIIMAVEVRDSALQERQFLDDKLMGFVV